MKIFLLTALFLFVSCQRQSPSDLQPDYTDSLSEVRRGESCKRVNLLEDLFELQNLRDLFICTTWEKSFPKIAQALNELNESEWDYLAEPLNRHFFNDRQLRDRSISLTRELDRKGGLDELGKVITSLSDSNFFYHVSLLFTCAVNPECSKASGITKDRLFSFYEFFKADSELIENLVTLMRSFSVAIKGEGASFKKSLTNNLKNNDFVIARNRLLSEVFLQMGDEDFLSEIEFYENLLFDESDGKGWLPHYLTSILSKDEFNFLNRYPVDVHKKLWKDFRILNKTLDVTVGCSYEDGSNAFSVDISSHLTNFIDILFSGDQGEFFRNSLQSVAILKAANEVCPNLRGYKAEIQGIDRRTSLVHEVNFVEMMEKTTKLMLEEKYYTIVRHLHDSRPNLEIKDNTFLIRYLSDNTFSSYVEMLRASSTGQLGLTSSLYDLISSLPEAGYPALKSLFSYIKEKPQEQRESLSMIWRFLGEEGRYFFFNFLDAHYKEESNLALLFDFYAAMFINAKDIIPKLFSDILDPQKKDLFTSSLLGITQVLGKRELLEEYRRFFSREHLLEMLRVISSGSVSEVAGASLSEYVLEDPSTTPPLRVSPALVTSNLTKNCLADLVKAETTFYSLLRELPVNCLPLRGEDPLFRFFDEASVMAQVISEQEGIYKTYDGNGFFAPEMITNVTQLLNVLSKRFGSEEENKEGLGFLVSSLTTWMEETKSKGDLVESLRLVSSLSDKENDFIEVFSQFYGQEDNFSHADSLFRSLSHYLGLYDQYHRGDFDEIITPVSYVSSPKFSCGNYHQKIGGRPCPYQGELKSILKRVIKRSIKKNDENPSALEQMLKMIAVDYGLPIPYESDNPRLKRVSLTESFAMFYSFTDRELATNRFSLEYNPLPMADDEYFATEDWEVSRKHAKDAPDPFSASLNTMERIEVVIRDVRFDENYLGAHYMNSVAKAEDYNKVVDSKYGLLKTCVPLKFCGKFMNKAQHRFAKNSKETFQALLDANTKEGWSHGDYMQSLLTSLVSSSPDKSQLSTIVNRRIFGLNIEIPWLNAKKSLVDHNGKILGLASMVGMFTNSARVLRDRVGRTREDFTNFLNGARLKKTDNGFLRNLSIEQHLVPTENLLKKLSESEALDDFLTFVYESDYDRQRLWEQLAFKGLYLFSYLSDPLVLNTLSPTEKSRYQNLSVLDFIYLADVVIENHKDLTETFELGSKETLHNLNIIMDVLLLDIEQNQNVSLKFLHEIAYFLKLNKEKIVNVANAFLKKRQLSQLKLSLNAMKRLLPKIAESKESVLKEVFSALENSNEVNWRPLQRFLKKNGAKNLCSEETSGYFCRANPQYRELQQILVYVFGDGATGFSKILSYLTGAKQSVLNQFFTKVFPSINTSS